MDITPKTEISTEQIVADFGEYYLDAGQNLTNLHMLPFESFDTRDSFTIIPTDDTILREGNVEVDEILQQYQDEFTPKGGIAFTPVQIPLYQMKIDQEFNPKKLQRSWLGFLTTNALDPVEWPFIRWFIESYLMKQAMDDMEMKAIYKGVYEAPEEGVPGEPGKTMDGIEKIMNDLIAAGKLGTIAFGTPSLDPVTFVEQVEDSFVALLPEKYRYMEMNINMNRTLRDRFKRGMRKKYNTYFDPKDISNTTVADFPNLTITGLASMQGKNRLWATPKYNALLPVKGFENAQAFKVETAKRKVAIYADWWTGANYVQPEILFSTDGDL